MDVSGFDHISRIFGLSPFLRFLGMRFEIVEEGRVLMKISYRPELIGNPELPALHGGVISALLDTAGGAAVWTRIGAGDRVSTVDLRVDYLRPGRPEDLFGEAHVIRVGNRVGVTELRAFHAGSEAKAIAVGRGVYNVHRNAASS